MRTKKRKSKPTHTVTDGIGALVGVWEEVGVPYADVKPDADTMDIKVRDVDQDYDTEATAAAVFLAAGAQIEQGKFYKIPPSK